MRLAHLFVTVLALLAAPAAASARTAPCVPGSDGPSCHFRTGKVTAVKDGDTLDVDIAGDGRRRPFPVRMLSVQAMELTTYSRFASRRRGECHAVPAANRLERLVRRSRGRVRISSIDPNGRERKGRLLRSVAVRLGGRWRDAGERLIREGHALWLPGGREPSWNVRYNRAEQLARRAGRNLWDPDRCGHGPHQVPLQIWAATDPLGDDVDNVNGEWVKVRNLSGGAIDIGGWWVRDSTGRFTFPRGTTVAPRATVTVHVGRGADSPGVFFWGLREPIFQNSRDRARGLGDGAYLFDVQGDLRAAMVYPCVVDCTDPLQGAVELTARPKRPESVTVRNVSSAAVDLYGYQLALPGSTYAFPEGSVVAPGGSHVVDVRRDWVAGRYMLPDEGGAIALETFADVVIACDAWGGASC